MMIILTPAELELYNLIADHFLFFHDELTQAWIEAGRQPDRRFQVLHDNNWREMEEELEFHDLIIKTDAL